MPSPSAPTLDQRIAELGALVDGWTREALREGIEPPAERFGQMLEYHLGWRDESLRPLDPPAGSGKKLRCALALLVCESVCGSIEPARHVAVAIELLHNFSLIHDDIQDESRLRRHRPTLWSVWGLAQGINAGDALFTLAQLAVLRGTDGLGAMGEQLGRELNRTALRLVEGQYLDIELQTGGVEPTVAAYEAMIAGKTAALFDSAARMGAMAAGAEPDGQDHYGRFGRHLGMAFQEQDDLLGVWGSAAETGKPDAADVLVRKKGLPAVLALSRPDAPTWLQAHHAGNAPLSVDEIARVVCHYDETGVRREAEERIQTHFEAADEALRAADAQMPARALLAAMCGLLTTRRA